jgi:2-keto-4-pentenoate hydratase/2-oxohepta-3-ene-1,7-dioic acid hydratase in catechol pathway
MRWVSYRSANGAEHCGLVREQQILGHAPGITLLDLLRSAGGLEAAAERVETAPDNVVSLSSAELLAPIQVPPSVRDFASFERHVSNAGKTASGKATVSPAWYEHPVFYFSNPAAIKGPHDDVRISPGSQRWDYEVEVAAVVADDCSNLDSDTAEGHIAGYMTYCDWSARDFRARELQFVYGPSKSKDGATSLGPFLVTPDELEPYRSQKGYSLRLDGYVNGEHYGGGSWNEIHWSFGEMLAHASRGTTLRTGDVVSSGTVGTGCIFEIADQRPYLEPGDVVRIEAEQLGTISARVLESE